MLPNFLVIGAAKSGTSSLHTYLGAHPQVFTPKLKELNYFAYPPRNAGDLHFWATTREEYEAYFAEAGNHDAVGEVAPLYLTSSVAPEKIRQTIPDVKLIAILRNPVDRAYSAYLMDMRAGRETADVQEAFSRNRVKYIEQGRYARYLARYYERFDASSIKVLPFEELEKRPESVLAELYGFLGVDATFRPELKVHNQGYLPRSAFMNKLFHSHFARRVLKPLLPESLMRMGRRVRGLNASHPPGLPPDLRAELTELYGEDARELQALTGIDFSGWRGANEPLSATLARSGQAS